MVELGISTFGETTVLEGVLSRNLFPCLAMT